MWQVFQNLWKRMHRPKPDLVAFPEIFEHFQALLADHQRVMELIADLGEKSGGTISLTAIPDRQPPKNPDAAAAYGERLKSLTSNRYLDLYQAIDRIFIPLGPNSGAADPLQGNAPGDPAGRSPPGPPELIGAKRPTWRWRSRTWTCRCRAASHHHPGLPAFPGAQPPGGTDPRPLESWVAGEYDERQASPQIQYSILAGVVPHEAAGEIRRQAEKGGGDWAVRSSAYGEDGELSLPGLHRAAARSGPGRHQGL